MMNLANLEKVILDQAKKFEEKENGIIRDIDFDKYLNSRQITVISGVRRSGKSTLLKQFSRHFPKFYYFNFDDERLVDFKVSDFQTLMIAFQKAYPAKVILLDEIQNVPMWERFVRRIYEEDYKIFITGSNANLLGSELATHLTGRYLKLELFPFSFAEFLKFRKLNYKHLDSETEAVILKSFDLYLSDGGFPEYIKTGNKAIISQVYEDIIYRDLLTRFKIREVKNFKLLVNYAFTNFTRELSYNALKNTLGFKSATTVKNFLEFTKESYLIFELYKFDYSLKKQYISNKKIYVIDNGLRNATAFSFSEDRGKLLENLVFLEFLRRGKEIYYYKDVKECDFLVKEKNKITEACQVTCLLDKTNEKRELPGLLDAMERFKLKQGMVITENQEETRKIGGKAIKVVSAWKWLLQKE